MKTGSNLPRRALATVLAVCAHLLVLFLLGLRIPRFTAPPDDSPALMLTLVRPQIAPRGAPAPPRPERAPSPPAERARVLTQPPPQAPLVMAPIQPTPAPVPPNLETNPNGDNVRDALRGLVGCTGALAKSLSHAEREACDRKLALAKPAPTGPLYTAKEAKAFETPKDSIFVRKPHNECLPHIGAGRGQPRTSSAGATTFGLDCEWDFW